MLIHLRITKTGNNKSVKVLDPQVQNLLRDLVGRCQPTDMLFPFSPDRFRTGYTLRVLAWTSAGSMCRIRFAMVVLPITFMCSTCRWRL